MILLYKIKIYSFYKIYLLRFINKFETYIKSLNVKNINFLIFTLPVQSKLFTVLKSPHVKKKSKEQFGSKVYTSIIKIKYNKLFDLNIYKNYFNFSLKQSSKKTLIFQKIKKISKNKNLYISGTQKNNFSNKLIKFFKYINIGQTFKFIPVKIKIIKTCKI